MDMKINDLVTPTCVTSVSIMKVLYSSDQHLSIVRTCDWSIKESMFDQPLIILRSFVSQGSHYLTICFIVWSTPQHFAHHSAQLC